MDHSVNPPRDPRFKLSRRAVRLNKHISLPNWGRQSRGNESKDSEIHERAHGDVRKYLYDEKDLSGREYNEPERADVGLQRGVKIMAMPYEKDNALCSPTSALEKKRMLSEELRNPS